MRTYLRVGSVLRRHTERAVEPPAGGAADRPSGPVLAILHGFEMYPVYLILNENIR
jgi:hypothetical protein